MNNNKQTDSMSNKRKNRLFSRDCCENQIKKLTSKKINTDFELLQIGYLKNRITQFNIESYMEGYPC